MTTIDQIRAPQRAGQDPTRTTSMVTGVLFVLTFVTSIPAALYLYTPVLKHSDYIIGAGADSRVTLGALLEIILVVANIGTAVTLFPLLKRQHEGLALGFVAARIVESVLIFVGILSVLTIVTLRKDAGAAAGADTGSLITAGRSLVAIHDWTFLLGPGLTVGLGNGLMLGYLMYRSHLVPRRLAVLGLIGGPLILASGVAVLFGLYGQLSPWSSLATVPEFCWELGLGIYLIVKGFRPSAAARLSAAPVAASAQPVAVTV